MEENFVDNAHNAGRDVTLVRPSSSLASTPSNSDESLLSLEIEYVRYRRPNVFARFLARFPWIVALLSFSVGLVCVLLSAIAIPFPEFNDPTKGFETHSTEIHARANALVNLYNMTNHRETLRLMPFILPDDGSLPAKSRNKRSVSQLKNTFNVCKNQSIDVGNYKVVFESTRPDEDLFNLKSFQSICDVETTVIRPSLPSPSPHSCHFMPSLPLYAMVLRQKDCSALTEDDVQKVKDLLKTCYPYYKEGNLTSCAHGSCDASVPKKCVDGNIPFKIFNFLVDDGFDATRESKLRYTMLVYNRHVGDRVDYYKQTFMDKTISHGSVKVVSVYGGIGAKFNLFNEYFLDDMMKYIVCAALICILIILLLYLQSFVLLIATTLTVGFSFATAYVIYYYILRITFFPFINILALLILIAVGADDVFIFVDAWKHAKKDDKHIPLENRVARTFNHAAMSIMVTSLTTAGSFFANFITQIVSIRCFAVFAGLAILANFFFMITWIPAIIVCKSKIMKCLNMKCLNMKVCVRWFRNLLEKQGKISNTIFGRVIPKIVETCWHVLILVFLAVGIGGMCVVFYKPRLQVPTTSAFPLFPSNQYMEKWDSGLDKHFRYIKQQGHWDLPVWFVWGLLPADNGKWYDSRDLGTLKFDPNFDLFSTESQVWLKKMGNAIFHSDLFRDFQHVNTSFFDVFEIVLSYCDRIPDKSAIEKFCCKTRKGPFVRSYLEKCFAKLWSRSRLLQHNMPFRVVFDKNNRVKAMYIEVPTKHPFSTSYHKMDALYHNVSNFLDLQLKSAPSGLKGGFSTSIYESRLFDLQPFGLYDLQRTLASGTHFSIMLSLSVAAILMFLTSLNLLLTIYAMLTITLAISVTIGSLVLMGWHLNVVESITISLAVGMSIDFTIHYGVSYRQSKEHESALRTRESFNRVGSAVVMAAITTFAAGAAMMPSHILAYTELGTFLMLVMLFSWLYATFFFQSLCHIIGPRGTFCQIPFPCVKKTAQSGEEVNGRETQRTLQLIDPVMALGSMSPGLYDDDTFLLPT